jgi:hypothetical protein
MPVSGLCKEQVGFALACARRERTGSGGGVIALALPRFGAGTREPLQTGKRILRIDPHRPRLRARRALLPFRQATEQPTLVPLRPAQAFADRGRPRPAQPGQ